MTAHCLGVVLVASLLGYSAMAGNVSVRSCGAKGDGVCLTNRGLVETICE